MSDLHLDCSSTLLCLFLLDKSPYAFFLTVTPDDKYISVTASQETTEKALILSLCLSFLIPCTSACVCMCVRERTLVPPAVCIRSIFMSLWAPTENQIFFNFQPTVTLSSVWVYVWIGCSVCTCEHCGNSVIITSA